MRTSPFPARSSLSVGGLLLALLLQACTGNQTTPALAPTVGGDSDAHGCKASAGYQWSALKNECIRIFEAGIRLDPKGEGVDKTTSAFVVFKSDDDDAEAEVYLPGETASRLFAKAADNGAGTWKNGDLTLSQWKGMYTLQDGKKQTLYEGAAAAAETHIDAAPMLQGKWQSAEDAKSVFEIKGKSIVHYYGGKKQGSRVFEYVADCSGNACAGGASQYGCYTSAGEMDIECFSIVSISDTEMETSIAGGTGNTLKYKRVK